KLAAGPRPSAATCAFMKRTARIGTGARTTSKMTARCWCTRRPTGRAQPALGGGPAARVKPRWRCTPPTCRCGDGGTIRLRSETAKRAAGRAAFAAREAALVAMFAAVTSVLAYVRIPLPFGPVPVTGQTFGLMLAGLLLGPRLAAFSQVIYLL